MTNNIRFEALKLAWSHKPVEVEKRTAKANMIFAQNVFTREMMTGRPPYDGESPVAVAIQHINGGAKMPNILGISRNLKYV